VERDGVFVVVAFFSHEDGTLPSAFVATLSLSLLLLEVGIGSTRDMLLLLLGMNSTMWSLKETFFFIFDFVSCTESNVGRLTLKSEMSARVGIFRSGSVGEVVFRFSVDSICGGSGRLKSWV
jgi:hypothetical protein